MFAFWLANGITLRHDFSHGSEWLENLRTTLVRRLGARIGKDSVIRRGAFITRASHLNMGRRSKLGPFAKLFLYDDLIIGDDVEIGSNLTVHTAEHKFGNPVLPLTKQGSVYMPVEIQDDVYIGSDVIILSGAVIESRVVIGAGSVVKGRIKSGFIYAGMPARPIRPLASNLIA
jgi:acetyltransferase-like isoleucine patch superfamily enzyme